VALKKYFKIYVAFKNITCIRQDAWHQTTPTRAFIQTNLTFIFILLF